MHGRLNKFSMNKETTTDFKGCLVYVELVLCDGFNQKSIVSHTCIGGNVGLQRLF